MVRRFLLPLLGVALFATTAATAQTAPAKPAASAYSRPVARTGRTLTAREKRAAEAAAKAEAAQATVAAAQVPATASSTSWNGWSDEPLPQGDNTVAHRPTTERLVVGRCATVLSPHHQPLGGPRHAHQPGRPRRDDRLPRPPSAQRGGQHQHLDPALSARFSPLFLPALLRPRKLAFRGRVA